MKLEVAREVAERIGKKDLLIGVFFTAIYIIVTLIWISVYRDVVSNCAYIGGFIEWEPRNNARDYVRAYHTWRERFAITSMVFACYSLFAIKRIVTETMAVCRNKT
ncbi:MAG: hypothetical protein U0903_02975 [Planctomycetales bacterium]